MLRMYVSS
jgi:hypothetical protein